MEGYLFLGKQIITPSPATRIKLSATVLIVSRRFSLLLSHLSLPSPFTAPWLTPLFMPPLLSLLSANVDDLGHDSRTESTTMATSSSPTRGATKMAEG
jgi:hypothetical protein